MGFHQSPPEKGRGVRHVHFCYVGTDPGAKWHAFIAGPCLWLDCHCTGRARPCLHALTGGELTCEACNSGSVAAPTGYQPLYREVDSRPVMVIVHDYVREQVDALRFHQRVLVGREVGRGNSLWIAPALSPTPRFTSTLPDRNHPADLTSTLLRVWKVPALTEWFNQTHPSDNPVSLPRGTPLKSSGEPFSEMTRAAAARYDAGESSGPNDETYEALVNRIKERTASQSVPSKNGKHDKKK